MFFFFPKVPKGNDEIIINNQKLSVGNVFQFQETKAWIIYINIKKDLIILSKSKAGDQVLKTNTNCFYKHFSVNQNYKTKFILSDKELRKLNIKAYKAFEKGKDIITHIIDLTKPIKTTEKLKP